MRNILKWRINKQLCALFALLFLTVYALDAQEKYYLRMCNSEMKRNPQSWMVDFSKGLGWNYCHGLELQSFWQAGEKSGNKVYLNYVYSYLDTIIDAQGNIFGYKPEEYNIDRLNTGKILFPAYSQHPEERFRKAMDLLRNQMKTHPRTSEGSFWHKQVYPHQVWLDGIYMAVPFLAQYAQLFGDSALLEDAISQIIHIARHSYDKKTGLYYHGWDESKQQKWADPQTGLSPNFWSRSIGWYMMAMVDALEFIPENNPRRNEVIRIFQQLSASIVRYQDPLTGMWYQVTDQMGREGNYLESTASAMFIYSWVKGAQKGYLSKDYLKMGEKAYNQYLKQFVVEEPDGTLSITHCCSVAGLGGTTRYRDGSFNYYVSEPVRNNDPKAIGPFIMLSVLLDR